MSFGKSFFSMYVKFFTDKKKDTILEFQAELIDTAIAAIRKEIIELIFKITVALVAVGLLLYSLIILAQHFHAYMLIYEKGILFSVLFFSALSVGCIYTISKLFLDQKMNQNIFKSIFSKTSSQKNSQNINFEKLLVNFVDGLNKGLNDGFNQELKAKVKVGVRVDIKENEELELKINDSKELNPSSGSIH